METHDMAAPAPPLPNWHLRKSDGQSFGPISKATLDGWVAEGLVEGDSLVYCDGWQAWRRADTVYAILASAPPSVGAVRSVSSSRIDGEVEGRDRRTGMVTAVGVIGLIYGVAAVLSVPIAAFSSNFVEVASQALGQVAPTAADVLRHYATLLYVLSFLIMAYGVAAITAGVGVLQRHAWGRSLALTLGGIELALALLVTVLAITMGVRGFAPAPFALFVWSVLLRSAYAAEFFPNSKQSRHYPNPFGVLSPVLIVMALWVTVRLIPQSGRGDEPTPPSNPNARFNPKDVEETEQWAGNTMKSFEKRAEGSTHLQIETFRLDRERECQQYVGGRVSWRMPVTQVDERNVYLRNKWPALQITWPQAWGMSGWVAIPIAEESKPGIPRASALRLHPDGRDVVRVDGTITSISVGHSGAISIVLQLDLFGGPR
jgi:hypothetical protein